MVGMSRSAGAGGRLRQRRLAVERRDAHPGLTAAPCTTSPPARRQRPCTARTGRWRRRCPAARRPCGGARRRGCRWRTAPTRWSRPRGRSGPAVPEERDRRSGRAQAGLDARGCGTRSRTDSWGAGCRRGSRRPGSGEGYRSGREPTERGRTLRGFYQNRDSGFGRSAIRRDEVARRVGSGRPDSLARAPDPESRVPNPDLFPARQVVHRHAGQRADAGDERGLVRAELRRVVGRPRRRVGRPSRRRPGRNTARGPSAP